VTELGKQLDWYAQSLDCVHCGLCLEACPTYTLLGLETDSPRGRIYLMRALAEGRVDDPGSIRQHFDQCLGCRACETVCPSGVRYGHLLEAVRHEGEQHFPERGLGARLRRWLLRHVVAHPGRLRGAFTAGALAERIGLRRLARRLGVLPASVDRLLPRVPPARERRSLAGLHPAIGARRGKVLLFTGCVMQEAFGAIHRATLRVLQANGFDVEVPAEQRCCGALHVHGGQADDARRLARANVAAFPKDALIVNNSAGCGAAMKEYGELLGGADAHAFAARCRDVTEVLAEAGLTAAPAPFPHRVAYDAPCHLCHGQRVRAQPLALLRQVPGIELVAHPTSEDCCGSAGIYNLLQPELAGRIGEAKAKALLATGAEVVATGNPGCTMQIQAHLRELGSSLRVVHPVELLVPRDVR
jgi:glycolate oxidase iron-sulfur subunit